MTDGNVLWPAEQLRQELTALNREFMREAANSILRGKSAWPNQDLASFADEANVARKLGVVPVGPGDPGFVDLMKSAQRFNWVISLNGELRVSLSMVRQDEDLFRISHAILVPQGGDVLAAGEGVGGEYLSNTTGHYQNESFVLPPVKRAFGQLGIIFRR